MTNPYDIALVLVSELVYIATIAILYKTYKTTRYPSHLILVFSFVFSAISAISRFMTSFYD